MRKGLSQLAVALWVLALLFGSANAVYPAADPWFSAVRPVMTSGERKAYESLAPQERLSFQQGFWTTRQISQQEYFARVEYIDQTFGSGKPGSGANTDRGRVYLGLGAPGRMMRLPSSRTFFPIEIWYYPDVPSLGIQSELALLFFRPRGSGEFKLYSPTLNTVRDLLNPQSSMRGVFGPNDVIIESDLRTKLTLSPAEDEVISAAVSVQRGVTGMGNDEILALAASPVRALSKQTRPLVQSKFTADKPELIAFQTHGPEGIPQIDLAIRLTVCRSVELEVLQGTTALSHQNVSLHFDQPKQVRYQYRLDLLPGSYRLLFHADSRPYIYALRVDEQPALSDLLLAVPGSDEQVQTPFSFNNLHVEPSSNPAVAVLQLKEAQPVEWRLYRGTETVWREKSEAAEVVVQNIGDGSLPPGDYTLEARAGSISRRTAVHLGGVPDAVPVLSQNSNLSPDERYRFIAHQYLIRGSLREARAWLARTQPSPSTQVEIARIEARAGHLDEARQALQLVLARDPSHFEALSALAYVEAQLQDYAVAARLYRRALAVQPSPVLEQALASLPGR